MRVVIAGASGFVGSALCPYLREQGHEVVALTRNADRAAAILGPDVEVRAWSPGADGSLTEALTGADGVVNLAGENLAVGRWTASRKLALVNSRLEATGALVEGIASADPRPSVLVSASAVGYYGDCADEALTEASAPGDDFLADLCQQWEKAAQGVEEAEVRLVRLRVGVVLGKGGGALSKMLFPFKLGIGGPLGTGRQWFSWVHRHDLVRLIEFCLTHEEVSGAINGTAPNPVTNRELSTALGKVLHRPSIMPMPAFALGILLGEMSDMLLTGQKVLPEAAQKLGFTYEHPTIADALTNILTRD